MEPLRGIAIEAIFRCLIQWDVEEMDDIQMKKALQLIAYFDKLPFTVRDRILWMINDERCWNYGVREPQAWDIAPFVSGKQNELYTFFPSARFDLEFLLKVCGRKLRNLTALTLPLKSTLTATACQQIRQTMPNLRKLNLTRCVIEDDAVTYITQLPLGELDAYGATEVFWQKLCAESSTLSKTLRKVVLNRELSMDCYYLLLNRMKYIEILDTQHSKWLKVLQPIGAPPQRYNLRILMLGHPRDDIEQELAIGALTCPEVYRIDLSAYVFTLKMLQSLSKFKKLRVLYVGMRDDSDEEMAEEIDTFEIVEENDVFDRDCLRDMWFDNLVEFTLCDPNDRWVSSGYLFQLLDMCPFLKKLTLWKCSCLSNKMARELADLMNKKSAGLARDALNYSLFLLRPYLPGFLGSKFFPSPVMRKKLECLRVFECDLLGPSGIEDLIKIDSLKELCVSLRINEIRRQHFDVGAMQLMAEEYGVCLRLEFLDPRDDMLEDDGGNDGA